MSGPNVWLAAGLRTPFAKADGALRNHDAIEISVPVVQGMMAQLHGTTKPDFAVWGTVLPNLTWSNIAREVMLDAKLDPTVPAFSTVMACSTSMMGAIEAAGMLDDRTRTLAIAGGSESLSQVQIGLSRRSSNWLRNFSAARGGAKVRALASLRPRDVGLYVPKVANRVTGLSMGEHMEVTAKEFPSATRAAQDQVALDSHRHAIAAWERGFFDDLIIPFAGLARDTIPRNDTSLEKLARLVPAFDRTSGRGTITAGNSSPLTDGAAGLWVASDTGIAKLPAALPRARMIDWEIASVDIWREGLLMAPAYAIPRLLARNNLVYDDIALWEIHEAFAAQVLAHLEALEQHQDLGVIARARINPNGGSIALGHPFGATGARILSQTVKELALMPSGSRAIVSICADGGQGSVALLQT